MSQQSSDMSSTFSDFIADRTKDFTGREWVFKKVDDWLAGTGRVFLLVGGPGTGKSAIMARLAQFSLEQGSPDGCPRLASGFLSYSHFCQAQIDSTLNPLRFVEALALALAARYTPFASALIKLKEGDKQVTINATQTVTTAADGSQVQNVVIENLNVGNISARSALDRFVRRPLEALCQNGFQEPIVILVDSLDEACTWREEENILTLLAETLDNPHDLPLQVRFVLACRPDERVLQTLGCRPSLDLIADAPPDAQEVHRYALMRLAKTPLEAGLRNEVASRLVESSKGNFLYARYILDEWLARPAEITLESALDLPVELSGIYRKFLTRELARDDEKWEDRYQPLLGLLAVARGEGLMAATLASVLGKPRREIDNALRACVQYLAGPQPGGPFRIYHQSFRDFLLAERFYLIYPAEAHASIARYLLRDYGEDWLVCQDDYALKHTPTHLVVAAQQETDRDNKTTLLDKLYKLLFDPNWLLAKLKRTDIFSVIADYEYLTDREDVRSLCSALRLSAFVLQHDKAQLKSQLYGRLMNSENHAIQAFLEQIEQTNSTQWLCPIRNSLTSPDGPLSYTLEGHRDAIFDIAITPDSRYAVSASRDASLKVWDIENGTELRTLCGHRDAVRSVAITPDGRYAISASEDATIRIWDLQRGVQCGEPLNGGTVPIFSVTVSADGKTIISGSEDGILTLWGFESRKMLTSVKAHKGRISALKVSPNGEDVFSASCDGTLRIWKWGSLIVDHESRCKPYVTMPIKAAVVTTSPDGQQLISAVDERTLQVQSQSSDHGTIILHGHTGLINSICMTPETMTKKAENLFVISASDDCTVRVWRLADGAEINTLRDHPREVNAVAISANGKYLLSGGWDHTLKVWDVRKVIETPESANQQDHFSSVNAVAITPDAKHAISASRDNNVKIWRLADANVIHTLKGHQDVVWAIAVAPDGRHVVSASWDHTLKVWDIVEGKEIYTLKGHDGPVSSVAVSPDGSRIVSASRDKTLKIWNLNSGTLLHTLTGHRDCVWSITITQDGHFIASGSWDRTVRIWDLQTGAHIRTLDKHPHGVTSVVATPDNEHLVSTAGYSQRILGVTGEFPLSRRKDVGLPDLEYPREMKAAQKGTMNVWSMRNGELLATIALQGAVIGAITVTPDSRRIIYAVDHQVRVSNIATLSNGVSDADLPGHEREISRLVAMQRRNGFLSASLDGSCRVWNLDTREVVAAFSGESPVLSCAVSPDDNVLVLGEESGRVHILRLTGGG